jgi:hypothetical protein
MNNLLGLSAIQSYHELQARVAHPEIWKPFVAIFDFRGSTSRCRLDHLSYEQLHLLGMQECTLMSYDTFYSKTNCNIFVDLLH